MKLRTLIGTGALGALAVTPTAVGCLSTGVANAAVPNCGGQSAPPQPVPYTCNLPGIDITAQGVTRHFSAQVVANGTTVAVTFKMLGGVLPVDVPIRIVHHEGISGGGGAENESSGVIPAGKTTATLTDSAPCRAGQLDVKAVDTSNGSGDKYRVGGPWIQNGTGCTVVTTTVPQTSTTTTPSSSTVPSSVATTSIPATTTPGPVESTAPTTGGGTSSKTTLPPTGSSGDVAPIVGLAILAAGLFLMVLAVRKKTA